MIEFLPPVVNLVSMTIPPMKKKNTHTAAKEALLIFLLFSSSPATAFSCTVTLWNIYSFTFEAAACFLLHQITYKPPEVLCVLIMTYYQNQHENQADYKCLQAAKQMAYQVNIVIRRRYFFTWVFLRLEDRKAITQPFGEFFLNTLFCKRKLIYQLFLNSED